MEKPNMDTLKKKLGLRWGLDFVPVRAKEINLVH